MDQRAVFLFNHVVEFLTQSFVRLVVLNQDLLIINRPGYCGQVGVVYGITPQAVNIGRVLRLYQAQYQVWPLNPGN